MPPPIVSLEHARCGANASHHCKCRRNSFFNGNQSNSTICENLTYIASRHTQHHEGSLEDNHLASPTCSHQERQGGCPELAHEKCFTTH